MLQGLYEQADRDGVTVIHRPLHESTGGGACAWISGRPVVYVDPRMPRQQRGEVLAHELAHARRGHRPRTSDERLSWPAVAREEAACDRDAARMLVDLGWLADVMALAEADGVTITAADVAAEAEVTVTVAERAMRLVQDGRYARAC